MGDILKKAKNGVSASQLVEAVTCLFAFAVPLVRPFSVYTLGVWFGICLLATYKDWPENFRKACKSRCNWAALGMLFMYALYAVSLIYADDKKEVLDALRGPRITFLMVPLAVIGTGMRMPAERLMRCYILGVLLFCIQTAWTVVADLWQGESLIVYVDDLWSNVTHLFYLVMQRTVASTHVAVAMILVLYLVLRGHTRKIETVFFSVALLLFAGFLLVSASRIVFLALVAVLLASVLLYGGIRRKRLLWGGVAAVLLIAGLAVVPSRVSQSVHDIVHDVQTGEHQFIDPRMGLWKSAAELIKDESHAFYGYGVGNVQPHLNRVYEKNGLYNAICDKLSCHNLYMQFCLETGWAGLAMLALLLVLMPLSACGERRKLAVLVAVLYAIVFLTENMLTRAASTQVFAFVAGLLLAVPDAQPAIKRNFSVTALCKVLSVVSVVTVAAFVFAVWQVPQLQTVIGKAAKMKQKKTDHDGKPVFELKRNLYGTWGGNAYIYYPYAVSRDSVNERTFELDVYVSPDYDGDWVRINSFDNHNNEFIGVYYDMARKGEWQRLKLALKPGYNIVFVYACWNNRVSLDGTTGQVLFSGALFD